MNKLNVGCGRNILPQSEGWVNLDISPDVGADVLFDLTEIQYDIQLPFPDGHFSEIYMSHVLEHLHFPLPILEELHRVAAPGCRLTIRVPYGSSDIAFEDPTHYRQYFSQSFSYFGQPAYARADYGYRGDWKELTRTFVLSPSITLLPKPDSPEELMSYINLYRNLVQEFVVVLEAVQPIRSPSEPAPPVEVDFQFPRSKP